MNNNYQTVMVGKPGRNTFFLGNTRKLSFNMGYIIPTYWNETLPGDKWNISVENLLRCAPLVSPVMEEVKIRTDWWFVPNRLLWDDWEKFISPNNDTERALIQPYFKNAVPVFPTGSLADHLEIPIQNHTADTEFNALPIAAYEKIWHERYRDQNLEPADNSLFEYIEIDQEDMSAQYQPIAARAPRKKAWDKDRFTAALPWASKGEQVTLPITAAGEIPVTNPATGVPNPIIRETATDNPLVPTPPDTEEWLFTSVGGFLDGGQTAASSQGVYLDPNGSLVVDINASSATINQLREAYALQRFYERDALGGNRYQEMIYAHFGVLGRDSRMNLPEFIGRIEGKFVFSEVLQTSPGLDNSIGGNTPLGTMGGHGISVNGGKRLSHYCYEHGIIMGLIHIMPKASYHQGVQKKWTRKFRTDHYFPLLANIGESPVYNREIKGDHTNPDGEFGYVPVWNEYREQLNTITGDFREQLNHFHMARTFEPSSNPVLSSEFITQSPTSRVFAVQYDSDPGTVFPGANNIWGLIYNNCYVSRLMPFYGKPI